MTDEEYNEIKDRLIDDSQGVSELPVATSLDGVTSLPALKDNSVYSVPLSLLKGSDGREVSIRVSNGYIQWSLNDSTWTNVVSLSELIGPAFTYSDFTEEQLESLTGPTGNTPVLTIGSVLSGDTPAASFVSGTTDEDGNPIYTLNLTLAKGDKGDTGSTPIFSIGTVTTLGSTAPATVNLTYTGDDTEGHPLYTMDLSIPKGADGAGAGNVLVNTTGLLSTKKYVFQPNADGSAEGTFIEVSEDLVEDSNYVHTDNNYTTTEKDKLAGIASGANNYVLPDTVAYKTTKSVETATSKELQPNVFYVWGEMASLTITLATSTDDAPEYMFKFSSGDTATTLSLPVSKIMNDVTIEANKTYEVSIMDGIAAIGEVSDE